MDVHSPKNCIFIGIDPYPFILTMIAKGLQKKHWTFTFSKDLQCPVCAFGQRKKGRQSTAKLLLAKSHWQRSIYVLQQWKDFQSLQYSVHVDHVERFGQRLTRDWASRLPLRFRQAVTLAGHAETDAAMALTTTNTRMPMHHPFRHPVHLRSIYSENC